MRPLTQNMEPSYLVGFLQALALQIEDIYERVEWVKSWVTYWGLRYHKLPWFVVVIHHPELVVGYYPEQHKPKPTFTVVSCHNATYFKMNAYPYAFNKIYYISADIEEMTYGQALELALHNKKIMSSTPGYDKLAPYTI
jgi:hypothetical protein